MEFWKVLTLAETTDENDLRAMSANKLRGPYVINFSQYSRYIAVLLDSDVNMTLSAFDVVDRKLQKSVYQRNTLVLAADAWSDYQRRK